MAERSSGLICPRTGYACTMPKLCRPWNAAMRILLFLAVALVITGVVYVLVAVTNNLLARHL
jgi:hypothetical protein